VEYQDTIVIDVLGAYSRNILNGDPTQLGVFNGQLDTGLDLRRILDLDSEQ
jgi:hypothetical protein